MMGRSKFPGKPTKLVNKKRISVLSGNYANASDSLVNNDDEYDTSDLTSSSSSINNDQTSILWNTKTENSGLLTTKTTEAVLQSPFNNDGDDNIQKMIKTPSSEQPPPPPPPTPPSKPPDNSGDGTPTNISPASINPDDGQPSSSSDDKSNVDSVNVKPTQMSPPQLPTTDGVQTRARTNPATPVTTATTSQQSSSIGLSTTTTAITTLTSTTTATTTITTSTNPTTTTTSSTTVAKDETTKKPKQKKTVTFKNVLETSDDITVKKVYNPDGAPLVPIIKKECLTRTQRYLKTECLVRPSRLTEILKNNSNNIDKLNSITFRIPSAITSSTTTSTLTSSANSVLSGGGLSPSIISAANLALASTTISASPKPGEKSDVIVGDKRFVLPKRSVHSCRVIKPNKRFLDGMDDTYNKRHLKRLNKNKEELDEGGKGEDSDENVREDEESITSKSVSDEETDDSSVDASEKSAKLNHTTNLLSSLTTSTTTSLQSPSSLSSAGKVILRQPKLTFSSSNTLSSTTSTDGPFSLNIGSISHTNSLGSSTVGSGSQFSACRICGTVSSAFNLDQNSCKFGVVSCEACRKFISKMIKKLAVSSSANHISSIGVGGQVSSSSVNNGSGGGVDSQNGSAGSSSPSSVTSSHHHFHHHNSSSASSSTSSINCTKGDGSCQLLPMQKSNNPKYLRKTFKERCHACWLKKCLKIFQVPSKIRMRLFSTLPPKLRDDHSSHSPTMNTTISSTAFSIKKEMKDTGNSTNIFATTGTGGGRMLSWPADCMEMDFKTSKILSSLSNPLIENNTTFGSSPLIKPQISEKPLFMVDEKVELTPPIPQKGGKIESVTATGTESHRDNEVNGCVGIVPSVENTVMKTETLKNKVEESKERDEIKTTSTITTTKTTTTSTTNNAVLAEPTINRPKTRPKKDNVTAAQSSGGSNTTQTTSASSMTTTTMASVPPVSDQTKRQRIDLKGPRVKHVCRSASIVLGQPIATFPSDSALENMDTPPRPESPSNTEVVMELPTLTTQSEQKDSIQNIEEVDTIINETSPTTTAEITRDDFVVPQGDLGLSPPATPIESDEIRPTDDEQVLSPASTSPLTNDEESVDSSMGDTMISDTTSKTNDENKTTTSTIIAGVDSLNAECQKPMTRKFTRPGLIASHSLAMTLGRSNINSVIRRPVQQKQPAPPPPPPQISIDFWENYDPAEVSRTGFGLIVTDTIPLRALCFLCGSAGLDAMIYCVCCCEPYHTYCVEDEYNLRHSSFGDETSFLDMTMTTTMSANAMNAVATTNQSQQTMSPLQMRLNWLCPRCTVCYTCNMSSGMKMKCQKCQKNYHTTCLGTSKRLLGADRPLICVSCLKCKSCGTTNVTKFVGNLPMCTACFRLRQRGNFCPLCQKCYEANDFDLKMMECGDCKRWVHAKCEGVPDEQYNMLSSLPESIEFFCKKCSKLNATANIWRDAVLNEFKTGLLSVIKLLSKSRQACALLKLSPRKRPSNCVCHPITTASRSIQFNMGTSGDAMSDGMGTDGDDDPMSFKCFCGAAQVAAAANAVHQSTKSATGWGSAVITDAVPTLIDVKRKINANEYYSVQDFNYDMQLVINGAGCDDLLMTTYKEILSETFPWFQNETKACTDALVEDMYDSSLYTDSPTHVEADQQVPMVGIPEDSGDYFYSVYETEDNRICMFCKSIGEGMTAHESRLLYCGHNTWAHTNCALWSAEVFEEIDGSLQNVHSAIGRGRSIKCSDCMQKGATVGCNVKNCGEHYHYPCARRVGCQFMSDKTVYCPVHVGESRRKNCQPEKSFEVLRPVYVELDRRKKKMIEPSKIQFLIGSLCVKSLGRFVPRHSDTVEAIVPSDYQCTRLYWSSKEPWKIVEYTVKTHIENNSINQTHDTGRNFTVDHSNGVHMVHAGLSQINRWHNSLMTGEEIEFPVEVLQHNPSHAVVQEEENTQNNADLLPPEIKDAIFEDLPHDLLDGISMLDILPKLMTYEDLVALDMKNEAYFGGDLLKEGKEDLTDYEIEKNNCDNEAAWAASSGSGSTLANLDDPIGGSSTLLGASSSVTLSNLKRSKSEIFARGITSGNHRSQQRSCSLTWNSKFDGSGAASVKRRKVSMFQELKLPENMLFSFGARSTGGSELTRFSSNSVTERRLSLQPAINEDTHRGNPRSLTWTATKKLIPNTTTEEDVGRELITAGGPSKDMLDRLKIAQLDGGVDDHMTGTDGTIFDPTRNIIYSGGGSQMILSHPENPVRCDRCQCTYRTHESFQRHLTSCEPMSTSESESESRSPDTISQHQHHIQQQQQQQQQQHNIMTATSSSSSTTTDMNFSTNTIQQFITHQQTNNQQSNGQQMQFLPSNMIQNSIPITSIQGGGGGATIQSYPTQQTQSIFAPTIPVNSYHHQGAGGHQIFSQQPQIIQTTPTMGVVPQTMVTLPTGLNIQNFNGQPQIMQHQQQQQVNTPQIIQIATSSGPQYVAITPQQLKPTQTTQQFITTTNSPNKNQLILPQPADTKISPQTTMTMAPTSTAGGKRQNNKIQSPIRAKGRQSKSGAGNVLPKNQQRILRPENQKTNSTNLLNQQQQPQQQTMMVNHQNSTQMMRANVGQHQTSSGGVVFQSMPTQSAPIIVQQPTLTTQNPTNGLIQYVTTDGQNGLQYITMPTQTNDYKPAPAQTQYLTTAPGSLVPGGFQLQTDAAGNLVLANTPTGLSVMPMQTAQPQVIGTLLQPQATTIQCGMMATEQMMLGSQPTLEMVQDPTSGFMYLTTTNQLSTQPVYYGLETIVRNTVMSSQQFVSTAMQGVLSQNSSFSATTTQVFQASKIEPIMDIPAGYVVLNNDGNLNMMATTGATGGVMQSQQMQPPPVPQPTQVTPQPVTPQQTPAWRYIKEEPTTPTPQPTMQTTSPQQITIIGQPNEQQQMTAQTTSPPKQSIILPKVQPIVEQHHHTAPQPKLTKTKPPSIQPVQRLNNTIKQPKASVKPKLIAKPVVNKTINQQYQKASHSVVPIAVPPTTISGTNQFSVPLQQQQSALSTSTHQQQHPQKMVSTTVMAQGFNSGAGTGQYPTDSDPKIIAKKQQQSHFTSLIEESLEMVGKSPPMAIHPQPPPVQQTQQSHLQHQIISPTILLPSQSSTIMSTPTSVANSSAPTPPSSLTLSSMPTVSVASLQQSTPTTMQLVQNGNNLIMTTSVATPTTQQTIQLPIAPTNQTSSGGAGIPTNIVNPIQQYTSGNTNANNGSSTVGATNGGQSRPTNRVLPMQTSIHHHHHNSNTHQNYHHNNLQKQIQQSSPTTPETKLLSIEVDNHHHHHHHNEKFQLDLLTPNTNTSSTTILNNETQKLTEQHLQMQDQHYHQHQQQQQQDDQMSDLSSPNLVIVEKDMSTLSNDDEMMMMNLHDDETTSEFETILKNKMEIDRETVGPSTPSTMMIIDRDDDVNDDGTIGDNRQLNNIVDDVVDDDDDDPSCDDNYEVKEQISQILENLENDECNKMVTTTTMDDCQEQMETTTNVTTITMNDVFGNHQQSVACNENLNSIDVRDVNEQQQQRMDDNQNDGMENLEGKENISPQNININFTDDAETMAKYEKSPHHNQQCDENINVGSGGVCGNLLQPQAIQQQSQPSVQKTPIPTGPHLLYEIQSQDGFTYKSTSITEIWDKVFEAVQAARKVHGLMPLPDGPLGEMSGYQMLGLKTNALKYLLEQLPGVEKCSKYIPKYHRKEMSPLSMLNQMIDPAHDDYIGDVEELKENEYGAARCEPYRSRSAYDMFSWLASRHRKQPALVVVQTDSDIVIPRRISGSNLPMAMRYRTLKETSKEFVGVYRSHIHGRGLFCTRDIEAGEMVIEYAGELIRSTLTDKREKYYDSKGIGCYMFKIDDNLVVDATMRGNAARFINHSCDPNCYSKVVDILGHKHIIIFALRRIVQGEELTYDYKFPFEDEKIPCSCGSKKCRKYLN